MDGPKRRYHAPAEPSSHYVTISTQRLRVSAMLAENDNEPIACPRNGCASCAVVLKANVVQGKLLRAVECKAGHHYAIAQI